MRSIATVSGLALLCASAAVARAGDLPTKKAAPVEPDYVRECTIGKFKGILIPGSETCFQPWGRVRSEVYYNERFARNQDVTRFRIRGWLGAEVLQPTEYGGLTGRIRFYVQQTTGATPGSTSSDNAYLDVAYFNFAGFTFGRFNASYFDFAPGLSYAGGNSGRGSDLTGPSAPPLVAYTLPMGDFTGTLSLEDGTYRRSGTTSAEGQIQNGAVSGSRTAQGGQTLPDLVGKLDWAQSWGSVSASVALHQVRSAEAGVDAALGYAGQLGTKINLPTPIKGGFLSLVAAYADGANSYTGTATNAALDQSFRAGTLRNNFNTFDAYLVNGDLKTTKTWMVMGGVSVPLTEQVTQSVFASYADVNQYGTQQDGAIWQLGSRVTWVPVKKLEVGAEVVYARWADVPKASRPLVPGNSDDSWSGRIRLQRDF
ncbi:porin [Nostoc sp. NIES-2111]